MSDEKYRPVSERVFLTSMLSALSIMLHFFKIPYPLMQALKFDLVGVPLFVIGFYSIRHLFSSIPIVWLGIALISQDWIGASMKIFAEASTILPGVLFLRRRTVLIGPRVIIAILLGVASRVISMSIANYFVLPRWAMMVGWVNTLEEGIALAKLTMPYIATFNVILGLIVSILGVMSVRLLSYSGLLK